MKVDVVLTTGPPDVAALVAPLVAAGVDGVATVEGPHDVFLPLATVAGRGDVDISTAVAIAFPRSPVHLAHAAWDLQTMSGGRFRLGLGTQVRAHVERRYGADFDQPAARMGEWVEAIRAIFATWQTGTPLAFTGQFTRHDLMPPLLSPPPLASGPPPILVGALGPRMVDVTARVADGIVLHPLTTDAFLATMVDERIVPALHRHGRNRPSFEIVGGALVGVHDGHDEASVRDGVRALVGFYGSTPAYREILDSVGAGHLQEPLRALTRAGAWDEVAHLVPDELLDHLAVIGRPDEVGHRLVARFSGRVDRLNLTFVQALPPVGLETVMAAVRGMPRLAIS